MSPRCTVTVCPDGSTTSAVSMPAAAASTLRCGAANQYRSPQTYSAVSPLRSATVSSPSGFPAYSRAARSSRGFWNAATVSSGSVCTATVLAVKR